MKKVLDLRKITKPVLLVLFWAISIWLLYPLVLLNTQNAEKMTKFFFYRSGLGIVILLILFGKSVFDLLYLQDESQKMPFIKIAFLTLYAVVIISVIFFIGGKAIILFFKANLSEMAY